MGAAVTDGGIVRIGVLGAARITPKAILEPAGGVRRARVVAVAARARERAEAFARTYAIARVHDDYAALLADPEIDLVYNALPMSLHAEWSIAALRAGKHVLCEKPFAANAGLAERMVAAAVERGHRLVEAFHYRFHPAFARAIAIVKSGRLGRVEEVEGSFVVEIPNPDDLRHHYATAGGATMDLGCYPLHWLRVIVGEEPEVVSATATIGNLDVDLAMTAALRFPSGVRGRMHCSMERGLAFANRLVVRGSEATLVFENPVAPHLGHALVLEDARGVVREEVPGYTTYRHQLEHVCDVVLDGVVPITGGVDAVASMRCIDAVYAAAGLRQRGLG